MKNVKMDKAVDYEYDDELRYTRFKYPSCCSALLVFNLSLVDMLSHEDYWIKGLN